MSDQKDNVPYSPEPGSALHRIKATEEAGAIEDQDAGEQRKIEKMDREDAEEASSKELEYLGMEWTHADRVKAKKVAEGYAEKSSGEIQNEAYHQWFEADSKGDKRPMAEIYSEFYGRVYPQFGPYRDARLQEQPETKLEVVLDDFLQGKDLK